MSGKKVFLLTVLLAFCLDLADGKLGNRPRSGEPVNHLVDAPAHLDHLDLGRRPMVKLPPPARLNYFLIIIPALGKRLCAMRRGAGCHSSGGLPISV